MTSIDLSRNMMIIIETIILCYVQIIDDCFGDDNLHISPLCKKNRIFITHHLVRLAEYVTCGFYDF